MNSSLHLLTPSCFRFAIKTLPPSSFRTLSPFSFRTFPPFSFRALSESSGSKTSQLKKMFKDYWYVVLPVHLVTSSLWFGAFYTLVKSGVDVSALLGSLGTPQKYLESLQDSQLGNIAMMYACYKIATPLRYTVTLGGTTLSIKYLRQMGLLKTTSQISKEMKDKGRQSVIKAKNELVDKISKR